MTKSAIPSFAGGANLTPNKSAGSPSLQTVLEEHSDRGLDVVTVSFTAADVAAPDTDGTALVKTLAAAVPAGKLVVGCRVRHVTPWTGGGVVTMLLTVGNTADPDSIVDDFACTGVASVGDAPAGVKPRGLFTDALIATITPDGATKVSDCTAGATHVDLYVVDAF